MPARVVFDDHVESQDEQLGILDIPVRYVVGDVSAYYLVREIRLSRSRTLLFLHAISLETNDKFVNKQPESSD